MENTEHACPYPWCSREEDVPCTEGGHIVTHYGPGAQIECSDDRVSTQVLGLPGHDGPTDVYVEVTAAALLPSGEHGASSVLLDVAEVEELIGALSTARDAVAGSTS